MADIQTIRKLLAEYGITNDRELGEAIAKTQKIDIGVFASPVCRKDVTKDGKDKRCNA